MYSSMFSDKWMAQLKLIRHLYQFQEYTLDQYQEFSNMMQSMLERGKPEAVIKEWKWLFWLFCNPVVIECCWDLLKNSFQQKFLEVTYLKKLSDIKPLVSYRIIFYS